MLRVFAAVILLAAFGCNAESGGYDELRARPEAGLIFPGSDQLRDGGFDAEMTPDGPQAAQWWAIFGTHASSAEILAFYEAELASRGWEPGGGSSGISGTNEESASAWHTNDFVFRLGFWKPERWTEDDESPYATVYEIRLIERTVGPAD